MKVLMFGWEFPPHMSGGLGTACYGLTKSMANRGVGITFVLPKVRANLDSGHLRVVGPEDLAGVEIEERDIKFAHLEKYLEVDSVLHPYLNEETYKDVIKKVNKSKKKTETKKLAIPDFANLTGEYGPNLISEVVRYSRIGYYLGKKEDFDVIHAHDWLTYLGGVEAKKVSGKPLIAHIHATEFDRSGEHVNQFIYDIERYGMEMADRVIAVSHRTRDMVINRYGIDPRKVTVVHNGVERSKPVEYDKKKRPFKKDKIVLFLGRITMQKGPEYFIEAAKRVMEVIPNVRFVMAGSGDMTRKMIERMASLKMMDKFHFTGFLNEADREKMFAMSDLYIMPSVSEPFGITPLEAMKYGIPVIISKQSGIAEVLDNVLKVDFWDVNKLANTIVDILAASNLESDISKTNHKVLEKINWDTPAELVTKVYEEVLR